MVRRGQTKFLTVALALVVAAIFLFAMTAGDVWHHHNSAADQATCPICHLTHQGFAPATADQAIVLPEPIEWETAPVEPFYRPGPFLSFSFTRAPPAAFPA
jgi:Protein of unknown function (DUF2946)